MARREIRGTRHGAARTWQVFDGATVAGEVSVRRRPDDKCYVFFDAWDTRTYPVLADAAARDLGQDLYVTLDDAEFDAIDACGRAGFTENRRESHYKIPLDPAATGLTPSTAATPAGFAVISVANADFDRLRLLDDDLRQDVPGTDGWRWEPEEFAAETFGHGFDAETYLIAVTRGGEYAGLARIWNTRGGPRLGLIAVRSGYRRRGIARALLRPAFEVLHARGERHAMAEADDENHASVVLLTSLGARRTGGTVELVRRHAD